LLIHTTFLIFTRGLEQLQKIFRVIHNFLPQQLRIPGPSPTSLPFPTSPSAPFLGSQRPCQLFESESFSSSSLACQTKPCALGSHPLSHHQPLSPAPGKSRAAFGTR
jgi:hypothetical protein